ncbi:MAG: hypothetical protein JW924_07625 [Fusobacteriaceae bacterium]|nr:hypothetical protein [Fusobacteriaceae bacterium]
MRKVMVLLLSLLVVGCGNVDKKGFDIQGINKYTKTIYDKNGYDKNGYDREGYNKEGYNKEGYDRTGYNKANFDKEGYNKEGYNKEGYDRVGYNKYKRDRENFNEIQREIFKKFELEHTTSLDYVINVMKVSDNFKVLEKSLYETNTEYRQRIFNEMKEYRENKLSNDFIFDTKDNVKYKYDSEKEELVIKINDFEYEEDRIQPNYTYFVIDSYGNKVEIKENMRQKDKYTIDCDNKYISIPLTKEEAKEIEKVGINVQLLIAPKYAQLEKIAYTTKFYETINSFYILNEKKYPAIAYKIFTGDKELYKTSYFSSGYIAYEFYNSSTLSYEPYILLPNLSVLTVNKSDYFRYKIIDGSLFVIKRIDNYYQEYEYIFGEGFVETSKKYDTWTEFFYSE